MKCTELIAQDHMILRRGLDILDRMVQIMEAGERIEIFDIRTVLRFLKLFGDEYHQKMEERVVYAALLRASPQEQILQDMLREHDEERELVASIEDALNPRHGIAFVRSSRRLIQLLRNHLDQEDTVLCEVAERLLSSSEDDVISAEFRTYPIQSETYANFSRLEQKYAPNARRPRGIEVERSVHA